MSPVAPLELSPSAQTPCQQALSNDPTHDSIHIVLTTLLSPEPALATSLHSLASHLRTTPASFSRLLHLHAVPLLVNIMALQPSQPDLQSSICAILSTLAHAHSDARTQIFANKGLDLVLSAQEAFPAHLHLQRNAFATLRALVLFEPARKAMLATPILDSLLSVLSKPLQGDDQLVYQAMATTARIVFESNATRERLGELGMVEVIVAIMKQFASLPSIIAESGLALRNLAYACLANQKRMNDAGVLALMFENLEKHSREFMVVDQISAAVGNMLAMDELARKTVLENKGYIRSLFGVLREFPRKNVLCLQLCVILSHLCEHNPLEDHASAYMIASISVAEGVKGADAIVATLENALQKDDKRLFLRMTGVTARLSVLDLFRSEIRVSGAFKTFLGFLNGEDRREEHVNTVLNCVASCLSGVDQSKKLFSELNGLETVLKSMSRWSESSETNEACVKVLDIAVAGQEIGPKDLVRCKADTTSGVFAAMTNFRSAAKIQEYGCSCLVKLAAECSEETSRMVRLGAHTHIQSVLSTHSGNPAVESVASQLQMLLGEKSTRQGRSTHTGSGGTSVSRRMSRSRCVGDRGERARSRNSKKSKSPNRNARALDAGLRAIQRANAEQGRVEVGVKQAGIGTQRALGALGGMGAGGRKVDRNPRKKLSLETICE
eukprot:GFKZ01007590.1.p1 GENE.GFKZ01007590.1~~GFKZ01007590.1.p1  ORF type:complete len:668 (-),score=89.93 GFKZ01007590.1:1034-3037(-)